MFIFKEKEAWIIFINRKIQLGTNIRKKCHNRLSQGIANFTRTFKSAPRPPLLGRHTRCTRKAAAQTLSPLLAKHTHTHTYSGHPLGRDRSASITTQNLLLGTVLVFSLGCNCILAIFKFCACNTFSCNCLASSIKELLFAIHYLTFERRNGLL